MRSKLTAVHRVWCARDSLRSCSDARFHLPAPPRHPPRRYHGYNGCSLSPPNMRWVIIGFTLHVWWIRFLAISRSYDAKRFRIPIRKLYPLTIFRLLPPLTITAIALGSWAKQSGYWSNLLFCILRWMMLKISWDRLSEPNICRRWVAVTADPENLPAQQADWTIVRQDDSTSTAPKPVFTLRSLARSVKTGFGAVIGPVCQGRINKCGGPVRKNVWGPPSPPIPSSRGSKVKWSIHLTWINDPRPFFPFP